MHKILPLLLLFSSCTISSPWTFDTILTQNKAFDSTRIVYSSLDSPLRLELIQFEEGTEAFLSLSKYRFHPTKHGYVDVLLEIDDEKIHELTPILGGNMRVRLSPEQTEKLIQSLRQDSKVVILIDGFENKITSGHYFVKLYEKMTNPDTGLFNFLKGPLR